MSMVFCAVIFVLMGWNAHLGLGECPYGDSELRRDNDTDSRPIQYGAYGSLNCTWTLPKKSAKNYFLLLDFADSQLTSAKLRIGGDVITESRSRFCQIYASSALQCKLQTIAEIFLDRHSTEPKCQLYKKDTLPRYISFVANDEFRRQSIYRRFKITFRFVKCRDEETEDCSQTHHLPYMIAAIILAVFLLAALVVIFLLIRRLRRARGKQSTVRFSRHGRGQNDAQPGTSRESESSDHYAAIGGEQEHIDLLHGQNIPAGEVAASQDDVAAAGTSDSSSNQCVYAVVNKPKT